MHKHGFRALGVSLSLTLGLVAFFATGAQAEISFSLSDGGKAGKFRVAGSSALVAGTKFTGSLLGAAKILIASKHAYVECKKGTIKSAEGLSESEISVAILFEECATFEDLSGIKLTACDILGEPASTGKIEAKGIAKAKLHLGETYVLLAGSPLATIRFGEECGIGVKVAVGGSAVGRVGSESETLTHIISFSESSQTTFQVNNGGGKIEGDRLLYGTAEAFLNANLVMEPTGLHAGKNWSII